MFRKVTVPVKMLWKNVNPGTLLRRKPGYTNGTYSEIMLIVLSNDPRMEYAMGGNGFTELTCLSSDGSIVTIVRFLKGDVSNSCYEILVPS